MAKLITSNKMVKPIREAGNGATTFVDGMSPSGNPTAFRGTNPTQVVNDGGANITKDFSVTAPTIGQPTPVNTQAAGASQAITTEATGAAPVRQPANLTAATVDPSLVNPDDAGATAAQGEVNAGALLSNQIGQLTSGMENGQIPGWAQPAVAAVESALASRGMSRSSVGEAEYFNAIMNSAIGIGSQQAEVVQQVDMQNLSNRQQSNMLDAQLKTNVLLSNQSATNAASQFNANSQNQINTFMAELKTSVDTFNVQQANAIETFNATSNNATSQFNATIESQTSQFNAAQTNAMSQFNQQIATDLDKFNAQKGLEAQMFNQNNALAIEQSNVQWRRQLATSQTAINHETNMANANKQFNLSSQEASQNWQMARDAASWQWQSSENALNRESQLIMSTQNNEAAMEAAQQQSDAAEDAAWAQAAAGIISAGIGIYFND